MSSTGSKSHLRAGEITWIPTVSSNGLPKNWWSDYSVKQPKDFRVLLVYPNLTMMLVPSVAIALFTGILKRAGYDVDLFDTTHYVADLASSPQDRVQFLHARPFDHEEDLGVKIRSDSLGDFVRKIDDFKPDLIVMSVVEDTFLQGIALLGAIQDAEIPTIIGGVFITASPETAISYPQVKMIGVGEGEDTIAEVAERVRRGDSCENVSNVWFKRADGSVIRNPMRRLVDLNKPLPDFSLFDEARFYRPMGGRIFKTIPLETYRGCPYSCTFCNSPMQVEVMRENKLGSFLRRKRIDVVREEIKYLIDRHAPEYFYIIDDSFLARPEDEIQAFARMYEEFKIPFWFNTRPENATESRLALMRSINCDRMTFGLECGNEQYRRDVINRAPTNKEIIDRFEIIAQSQIAYSINNIIGFPGETRELIFDTVELNRQLWGYDAVSCSIFTPYHGTKLRELAVERGYMSPDAIMTSYFTTGSVLNMPQMTPSEINGLLRAFTLYVRFPKEEWPEIRLAEAETNEGNRVFEGFQQRYRDLFFDGSQVDVLGDWEEPNQYAVPPTDPTATPLL